jgi:hypothetical protein
MTETDPQATGAEAAPPQSATKLEHEALASVTGGVVPLAGGLPPGTPIFTGLGQSGNPPFGMNVCYE